MKQPKKTVKAPVKTIGPNNSLQSQVLLEASNAALLLKDNKMIHIRNGIIDDESLGIETLSNEVRRINHRVSGLRELSKYIHVGAIAPEEDTIDWVVSRVEKLCEQQMDYNALKEELNKFEEHLKVLFMGKFFSSKAGTLAIATDILGQYINSTDQKLRDKDAVSKELSDQVNILADLIMSKFPDKITDDGAVGVACNIILDQQRELDLKRAALDDAMKQFNDEKQHNEELNHVIQQANNNLKLLSPDASNFDVLLKLVMQHVVNSGDKITVEQRKLLNAISIF